jgi:DNA-directed RNA polymerase specialized sigma24 family protein
MNGESKQGMCGDVGVCRLLRQIVSRCSQDPGTREDLMQECLVHLWLKEHEQPGQTRSWYLQSCRFHAQHYLDLGKSLDSPKRANGHRLPLDGLEEEPALAHHREGEVLQTVSARDLVEALMPRLTPRQRNVLCGLAQGLDLREIAIRTGLSYPTVLKYRNRIAFLVLKLSAPVIPKPRQLSQSQPPAGPNFYPHASQADGNTLSRTGGAWADSMQRSFAVL